MALVEEDEIKCEDSIKDDVPQSKDNSLFDQLEKVESENLRLPINKMGSDLIACEGSDGEPLAFHDSQAEPDISFRSNNFTDTFKGDVLNNSHTMGDGNQPTDMSTQKTTKTSNKKKKRTSLLSRFKKKK